MKRRTQPPQRKISYTRATEFPTEAQCVECGVSFDKTKLILVCARYGKAGYYCETCHTAYVAQSHERIIEETLKSRVVQSLQRFHEHKKTPAPEPERQPKTRQGVVLL